MRHDGISPVNKSKNKCTEKYISQLKCSRISFLKIFHVPYAFTDCNLRVGQFDVSVSNMIIVFLRQYFTELRLMDSKNA